MTNIAICDNEIIIVNKTKKLLEEYGSYKINISTFTSGEDLINSSINFDIIFLDIDMEGLSGIDTAKKIRAYDKKVKIIYITNYTDYTYEAFGVHAFAYLTKPIKSNELYKQLDEALSYTVEENDEILEFITTEGVVRVKLNDIFYFEYQSRKIIMKTRDKSYTLNKKISEVVKEMEDYSFEIPHKSFCINLYNVKNVKGYDIYMMDGSILPLSQKKSSCFRDSLNIYLSNRMDKQRGRNR